MKQLLFTCLLSAIATLYLSAQDYNVVTFGAVPDGKTLNTESIQKAIDQAHQNGGGRVVIPAGRFLSGSLVLKSNVELHLEKKAVLLGTTDPFKYIKINRFKGLVMADNAQNIALTGSGTLDGQGATIALTIDSLFYAGQIDSVHYNLVERRPKINLRPRLVEFVKCRNAKVTGVTLKDAASWVQVYNDCINLVIDNVRVESDHYWNNDGLDLVDCQKVRVTNCFINSSDDGICLKSDYPYSDGTRLCDSIYIADCTIRSSASAIKFGRWSYNGFKNITIKNIKIYDTFRSAIALELVDGGTLENVRIENVKATNTGNALFIRLGTNRYHERPPGILQNIVIKDLEVSVPFGPPDLAYEIRGPELPFFHNTFPASITGIPGYRVKNVTLENIQITYPGRGNRAFANLPLSRLDAVPEKLESYPEFSMFGELPAWGLYVRHTDELTLQNVQFKIKEADYRPAMVFDDVKQLTIRSSKIEGDNKPNPVALRNVQQVVIEETTQSGVGSVEPNFIK